MRQIFVKFEVERYFVQGDAESGSRRTRRVRELVGVREYFPATLRAAVRQKSRWVVGIAMQGWSQLGWSSDWRTNYMLYRDRKSLVTNVATIAGYIVVSAVLGVWVMQCLWPDAYRFPPLVQRGSTLWYMLLVNFAFLSLRILQRAYCVWRLHGCRQAALSLPRMAWSNVVNFAATVRAMRLYLRYLRTGQAIAWDKTDHIYPALESTPFRRPLGEAHANTHTVPA